MTAQITTLTCQDASLAINHFGAQVFSWKVAGTEQLFLSSLADHAAGAPLRGGIPVCFPWFGAAAQPFHGFARNHAWELLSATADTAVFKFSFDSSTYPTAEPFILAGSLTLTFKLLSHSFQITAEITNAGQAPAPVELGLHGYFATKAPTAQLRGITGAYVDYVPTEPVTAYTDTDLTPVPVPVNRVYEGAPEAYLNQVRIRPSGFTHTVVWNPGEHPGMADLPNSEALDFVCVEQLYRNPEVALVPGDSLQLAVEFSI
ncbi:MAG: hypothetical protein Q4D73_04525 [Actinomycetaceae bacterium]|nr:hypothetical protein [Actinomycetaceae bacterium]